MLQLQFLWDHMCGWLRKAYLFLFQRNCMYICIFCLHCWIKVNTLSSFAGWCMCIPSQFVHVYSKPFINFITDEYYKLYPCSMRSLSSLAYYLHTHTHAHREMLMSTDVCMHTHIDWHTHTHTKATIVLELYQKVYMFCTTSFFEQQSNTPQKCIFKACTQAIRNDLLRVTTRQHNTKL